MMRSIFVMAITTLLFAGSIRANTTERINVRDFAHLAADGNWSPAIQAAIDSVNADNGYIRGGDIYFPPGDYRVDETIVLGRHPEHWGVRLIGYGARLVGSAALHAQPQEKRYRERLAAVEDSRSFTLALIDEQKINPGPAILKVYNPPGFEGAGYVFEGLTFDREPTGSDEKPVQGIGILIPAETVPKGITFRSIKVFNQEYGIFVNFAWQLYVSDCIFRHNRVGIYGRNHFNNVGIIHSIFRRNHHHGIEISNQGQWGSNGIRIAGSIFEANKGYGILDMSSGEVIVSGCYFEANGNGMGAYGWYTTVDTSHFWGSYGENPTAHSPFAFGWKVNPHSDQAHIIARRNHSLQLRNNRYGGRQGLLLTGPLRVGGRHRLDNLPVLADGVEIEAGFRAAAEDGLGFYEYVADQNMFIQRYIGDRLNAQGQAAPDVSESADQKATRSYPCGVCGHRYSEKKGDPGRGVAPGTRFHHLPADWTCPACGADKTEFFVPEDGIDVP